MTTQTPAESAAALFEKQWAEHEALLKKYNTLMHECHREENTAERYDVTAAHWEASAKEEWNTPQEKRQYTKYAKADRKAAAACLDRAAALRAEAAPVWEAVKAISRKW